MNYHDRRYDRSAPWRSHRSDAGGGQDSPDRHRKSRDSPDRHRRSRDSPDRYRKSRDSPDRGRKNRESPERRRKSRDSPDRHRHNTDSPLRRYPTNGDRRYHGNRDYNNGSYGKRPPSHDLSRYRYVRKANYDVEVNSKEGQTDEFPPQEREPSRSHVENTRSNQISPDKPSVAPWIANPDPTPFATQNLAQSNHPFHFLFQHINQHSSAGETGSPMSLIDRLIADEAMRMLSQVASSNETTTLNEPCEQEAISTAPAATPDNSSETPQEVVVIVDDSNSKTTDRAAAAAAVRAADSALLQKSAEQVTKKLLNQLTTMSKYDLKQMIDNPAGKYETALNRHAQSKLRAEVRKQLKCIGLSNELGKTRENGTNGMEADEAIDADKIPTALLQQIGQALDLDLLDYVSPEPKPVDALEQATSNDLESIKVSDTEGLTPDDSQTPKQTSETGRSVSGKGTKKSAGGIVKPTVTPTGRRKGKFVQNANTTTMIVTIESEDETVVANAPPKPATPNRKRPNIPPSPTIPRAYTSTMSPLQKKIAKTKATTATCVNSCDKNPEPLPATESSPTVLSPASSSGTKFAPFLRVSTVEELNKRLDEPQQASDLSTPSLVSEAANEHLPTTGAGPFCTATVQPKEERHSNETTQPPTALHSLTTTSVIRIRPDERNSSPNRDNSWQQFERAVKQYAITEDQSLPASTTPNDPDHGTLDETGLTKANRKQLLAGITDKNDRKRVFEILQRSNKEQTEQNNSEKLPTSYDDPAQPDVGAPQTQGAATTKKRKRTPKKKFSKKKNHKSPGAAGANAASMVEDSDQELRTNSPVLVNNSNESGEPRKQSTPREESTENRENTLPLAVQNQQQDNQLNNDAEQQVSQLSQHALSSSPSAKLERCAVNIRVRTTSLSNDSGMSTVPACLGVPSGATKTSFPPMTISCVQSGAEVQPLPLFDANYKNEQQQRKEIRILPHTEEGAEEMLTSSSLPSESTQPTERIPSPQSMLNASSDEYILGDEDEDRYIAKQAMETQTMAPVDSAKLQPLLAVTEQMQSIDAQTVELFNRKMQIDTTIMNLNAERMEIDQQLVKLQHIRGEQMNFMRACLQELGPVETMQPVTLSPVVKLSAQPNELQTGNQTAQQPPVQQQQQSNERTIRRITPIGGNSVLMSIFQRRRVPSERSTEENQAGGDRT